VLLNSAATWRAKKLVLPILTSTLSVCNVMASDVVTKGPPVVEVPTFFATDRSKISSNQDLQGARLHDLHVGCATVIVPSNDEWFDGHSNLNNDLKAMGWRVNQEKSTYEPFIEVRGYVAEPRPEKVLSGVSDGSDFWKRLNQAVAADPHKNVFIYIHGFAASGESAVYSGGVLESNVQSPVVAFTWPSQGSAGLHPLHLVGKKRMRARYLADRAMIDDPQVLDDLATFLHQLKTQLPDARVNLVAHSLGNRLLSRYLAADYFDTFEGVYFLAADVDEDLFMSAVAKLKNKAKHVSVYVNPKDRVLLISAASNLIDGKIARKLGDSKFSVPGIEFIDYREIAQPTSREYLGVRHYIPFEQFGSIVRTGAPASVMNHKQLYLVRRTKIERKSKHSLGDRS
jgi:esterase/lipase superfamily enzyme